jgi:hypothetical protein
MRPAKLVSGCAGRNEARRLIGFAGKHHSAAHGLRVRCKIAYHELIPVTAGGVVVGITVGIEAAKTTKASTKATALETTAAETAVVHREPAASEPAVVYREAAASETAVAHRKPVTSEAAAHGVTSEAAAHRVTSAAKATAAMSAPAASMSAPATKRHSAGGRHCHAEGDSRCGRNQFPSHRSLSLFRIRPPQYRKCMAPLPCERITN